MKTLEEIIKKENSLFELNHKNGMHALTYLSRAITIEKEKSSIFVGKSLVHAADKVANCPIYSDEFAVVVNDGIIESLEIAPNHSVARDKGKDIFMVETNSKDSFWDKFKTKEGFHKIELIDVETGFYILGAPETDILIKRHI